MHIIDPWDLGFACLFCVLATYHLLGAFSSAPWLHTNGQRKDGKWVLVPMSTYNRAGVILAWSTAAGINFRGAFYDHTSVVEILLVLAMITSLTLLYWLDYSSWRKNQKTA